MIYPSKYERLENNSLVIGSHIIRMLKKKKSMNVETVFEKLKKITNSSVSVDKYYNIITFLWLSEVIILSEFNIRLKK